MKLAIYDLAPKVSFNQALQYTCLQFKKCMHSLPSWTQKQTDTFLLKHFFFWSWSKFKTIWIRLDNYPPSCTALSPTSSCWTSSEPVASPKCSSLLAGIALCMFSWELILSSKGEAMFRYARVSFLKIASGHIGLLQHSFYRFPKCLQRAISYKK